MTAPPFILSSTSLTEFSSYWAEHPGTFVAPASEPDPAKRSMLVLKWFLTTLKQQYSSRNEKLGSEKKPLNPFLGELFLGKWEDDAGETLLVSEQVSHHPPVTAYCIRNEKHGIRLQGYNAQKASVGRRIDVKQIGHALLHLEKYNEDYLITLPSLHIEGLFVGSPYVELNGATYIQSSSGYTSKIDYSGKGWISGKKNSFTASMATDSKPKEPLISVEGQWTGDFSFKDARTKQGLDSWSHAAIKTTPLKVAPVDQQDALESRRAWRKVAEAIGKGDIGTTSSEKTVIETSQRDLRKKETAAGKPWERIFFTRHDGDATFEKLAGKIGETLEADRTGGVWRFDADKAAAAKSPYRPGTMPE